MEIELKRAIHELLTEVRRWFGGYKANPDHILRLVAEVERLSKLR